MADSTNSTGDPDVDAAFGGTASAAPIAKAVTTGDPDVDRALPQLGQSPKKEVTPPVKYDAALFRQRVGRDPSPIELANFSATKGVGWAGDTDRSLSPVGTVADRLLGGTVRGIAGGYKGISTLLSGGGPEQAAKNVEAITSQEGEGSPKTAAVLSSPYNPLNYVDASGKYLGDKAADLGAPPVVSTAFRVAPDAIASVLGLRGMNRGSVPAPTMAEPEAVANTPHPLQGTVDAAAQKFAAMKQTGAQYGVKLQDRPPNPQVVNSNAMIQDELDLPRQTSGGAPAPITKPVLSAARTRVAGPAYDTVREVPEFNVSDEYEGAIKGIDMTRLPEEMRPPGTNGTMSGEQAVDLSRELRARASKFYASAKLGHPELEDVAEAHRSAAEAVEDEVSRHLSPEAVNQWDNARTYVAKTYNVEGALDGAGNVVVPKLKAQMMKNKPLTGNIETLATLGAMDPTAFATRPTVPAGPGLLRRAAATVVPTVATGAGASVLGVPGAIAGRLIGENISDKILNR